MRPSVVEAPDRLRRSLDFQRVQGSGRRQRSRLLSTVVAPGTAERCRVGFAVSRKVGGAVVRNRVKRWLREATRALAAEFPATADVVIIAQPAAADSDFHALQHELGSLLSRYPR